MGIQLGAKLIVEAEQMWAESDANRCPRKKPAGSLVRRAVSVSLRDYK